MTTGYKDMVSDDLPRGIGAPATAALAAVGITKLSQVAMLSEKELSKLHGVGPKAIRVLQEALTKQPKTR